MDKNNIWFIADLHIGHKNILFHQPNRIEAMSLENKDDIKGHDSYIVNMWLSQTKKGDHIYVLGDMIMGNQQFAIYVLNRLKSNGCKIHLVVGNHDKSIRNMTNMFESIDLIKRVIFKKNEFEFLNADFEVILSHYPLKSWEGKCRGSMNLYGHVHDNALWVDEDDDLCFNVGIDSKHSKYKLYSLEEIYSYYLMKLDGMSPREYISKITKKNKFFVR
jgi:calcineurin-like phosphoesterase family protein